MPMLYKQQQQMIQQQGSTTYNKPLNQNAQQQQQPNRIKNTINLDKLNTHTPRENHQT